MSISFAFKNNTQIVKFIERLSVDEEPIVRLKLDEKINQGRSSIMFQLEEFDTNHEESKNRVLSLMLYCIERKVTVALCIAKPYWAKFSKAPVKMFSTEAEAYEFFAQASIPAIQTAKPTIQNPEADQQEKAADEVLKKYTAFQQIENFDPHSLKKMSEMYALSPSIACIEQLERAVLDVKKRKEKISQLEEQCYQMSAEAFNLSSYRKMPLNDKEFQAEQKLFQADQERIKLEHQKYQNQIEKLKMDVAKYKDVNSKLLLEVKDKKN